MADHGHHSVTQGCFPEIVKSFERGAELEQWLELWRRVRIRHRFFLLKEEDNHPSSAETGGTCVKVALMIGKQGNRSRIANM